MNCPGWGKDLREAAENALGTGQPAAVWSGLCPMAQPMGDSWGHKTELRPFLGSSEKAGRVRMLFPKPRLQRNQCYTIVFYREPGAGEREGRVVFPLRYLY